MKQIIPQGAIAPDPDSSNSQVPSPEINPETNPETSSDIIHLYIRGNYRQDIFFDKVDCVNAWNRIWLSANATGIEIFAVEILSNHLHICIRVHNRTTGDWTKPGGPALSKFVHHLRMSLSLFFNHRYDVHGSLGSRRYGSTPVVAIDEDGGDDLCDLIRYIIRNVTHHKVTDNYREWQFSTFGFAFDIIDTSDCYTGGNIPDNLRKAYFPSSCIIPQDWTISRDGIIIPPQGIFPKEDIEKLFFSKSFYLKACDTPTRRERASEGEKNERMLEFVPVKRISDQEIIDFIGNHSLIPIISMNNKQIKEAIKTIKAEMTKVSLRQLARIFHIPASTIGFWLKK